MLYPGLRSYQQKLTTKVKIYSANVLAELKFILDVFFFCIKIYRISVNFTKKIWTSLSVNRVMTQMEQQQMRMKFYTSSQTTPELLQLARWELDLNRVPEIWPFPARPGGFNTEKTIQSDHLNWYFLKLFGYFLFIFYSFVVFFYWVNFYCIRAVLFFWQGEAVWGKAASAEAGAQAAPRRTSETQGHPRQDPGLAVGLSWPSGTWPLCFNTVKICKHLSDQQNWYVFFSETMTLIIITGVFCSRLCPAQSVSRVCWERFQFPVQLLASLLHPLDPKRT